jgi:hypothetical protein
MLRIFFISLVSILISYFVLLCYFEDNSEIKPVFLSTDVIALAHTTCIDVTVNSRHKPDSAQIEILKKDYSNLWAHLNHLYATNDVEAGKEYYTEDWFKQICKHYKAAMPQQLHRHDEKHNLHIENWSTDDLICTAIDSNVVLNTTLPDNTMKKTKANIAVVLLLQGDHWRIDAMRVISETSAD